MTMSKSTFAFVSITFVLCFFFSVQAIVCPENVCENVQCERVDESVCGGPDRLIKKGGFCECCDTCFSIVVCLPDFCSLTKCPKIKCSSSSILQKGGFCNCCYVCFDVKGGVGEYCGFPLYGLPPPSIVCKEGLSCIGGFCLQENGIDAF